MAMIDWPGLAMALALVLATAVLYPVIVKLRRRGQGTRPEGIDVLFDPPDAQFEIVAVHGLGANPEYTWTRNVRATTAGLARGERVHLLRDLIAKDFPEARISNFAYNSDWLMDAPVKTAQQIADRFLDHLRRDRSGRRRLPTLFLGHSFGGIIIKEALCRSGHSSRDMADDTYGIIFLGTPHQGSAASAAGAMVASLTAFLGSDTTLLLSLRNHRSQLSDLDERFGQGMREKEDRRQKTKLVCFHETKPTYWFGWLSMGIIVDRDSARCQDAEVIHVDVDHSGLNKCSGPEDEMYQMLRERLRRLRPTATPTLNRNQEFVVQKLQPIPGAAFDSRANEYGGECLDGTRHELLKDIDEWARDPARETIYWLQGKAGTGKSTIARTVARNLGDRLAASFFFKRGEGDRGNARFFFTTLAAQVAQRLPAMAEYVRNAIESDPDIAHKALGEQFRRLLLKPLEAVHVDGGRPEVTTVRTVVIDALDECDGDQDIKAIIYLVSRMHHSEGYPLKFFLTSRFEPPIRLGFKSIHGEYVELPLHEIPEPIIERDITLFLSFQLEQIREEFQMESSWPSPPQLQALLKMAIPLFIFAATACRFVRDDKEGFGGPDDRLQTILQYQAFGDLNPTYLPALDQMIFGLKGRRRIEAIDEFRKVVGSIITITDPLSAACLARLLGMSAACVNNRLLRLHSVLDIPSDIEAPVRIFHESFRDFLIHPDQRDHEFWVDASETHKMLADRCLQLLSTGGHLKKDICGLQMPGTLRNDVSKQKIDSQLPPEVQYACLYWVHHAKGSNAKLHDGHQALQFLQVHFLHWLEALSLMGRILESSQLVGELQSLVDPKNGAELSQFLHDARRFILNFRSSIDQAPLQVYSSALLFAPEGSVIRQTFKRHIDWVTTKPIMEQSWNNCLETIHGHKGLVTSVAVSSDGQLASGSLDGTVKIWNATTGALQQILEGHAYAVYCVAFSIDGRLASGSHDRTVKIWDATTGALQQTLEGHANNVNSVAFSIDGRLASGSDDGTVKIWDATTGAIQRTLKGSSGRVRSVAFFSHDGGRLLASAGYDRSITVWDTATGQLQHTLEGHDGDVYSVAFSANGDCRLLASGSGDCTVNIWDATTWKLQRTLEGHSSAVASVAFSLDGRLLASGSRDHTVNIWHVAEATLQQTLKGHGEYVNSVAFLSKDWLIASGSHDNTVKIWDVMTKPPRQTLETHGGFIYAIAVSSDGRLVASSSFDGTVKIWVAATGALQRTLKCDWREGSPVAFAGNGPMLALVSDNGVGIIEIWNAVTGRLQQTLKGHDKGITWVGFSSDGGLLASKDSCCFKVWDTAKGTLQHTIEVFHCHSAALSGDGRLLASISDENTVKVWESTNGTLLQTLKGPRAWSRLVAFSADGQLLALASWSGTINIWDTTEWTLQQKLQSHDGLRSIAFSSNNSHLLTSHGRIRLSAPRNSCREQARVTRTAGYTPDFSTASHPRPDNSTPKQAVQADETLQLYGCGINRDAFWITWNGQRALWLPPDYRTTADFAISSTAELVALGCQSNRVITIGFRPEGPA